MTAAQKFLVEHVLGSDALFWGMRQFAPRRLVGILLASDPALLDHVPESERERAFASSTACSRSAAGDAALTLSIAGKRRGGWAAASLAGTAAYVLAALAIRLL